MVSQEQAMDQSLVGEGAVLKDDFVTNAGTTQWETCLIKIPGLNKLGMTHRCWVNIIKLRVGGN